VEIRYKKGTILIADRYTTMKTVAEQNNSRVYANRLKFKVAMGICLMVLSYAIGWPGIAFFSWLSFHLKDPLWIAVGGPLIYGISHLIFLLGAYMVGERYAKSSWKWGKRLIFRMIHKDQQADLSNTDTTGHFSDKKE